MQKYLKPNESKIKLEEAQEIFKMRSRVSNVKTNFKGKYQSFECMVCKIEDETEDETQQHIIQCKEINKIRKDRIKPPEYEGLYENNVEKQVNLVWHFLENVKIKEKFEKWKANEPRLGDHVTEDIFFFMSALYTYNIVLI